MKTLLFSMLCYVFCYEAEAFSAQQSTEPAAWSGPYAGVLLGGQFGRSSDKTEAFGYNADNDEWKYNESGVNAGAILGYHFQGHHVVIGPEVELGYLGMTGYGTQPASPGLDTLGKSNSDFYTAFRAHMGVDFEHYLPFATAGLIGVNEGTQVIDQCTIAPCGGSTIYASKNGFIWGYIVGGGVTHRVAQRVSVTFDFFYFNLGNQHVNGATELGEVYEWAAHASGHIVRGGLNYYF